MTEIFAVILIFSGLAFFIAGSIGLLRLPDAYSRLHALTKADNVGLGFLAFGLLLLSSNSLTAFKLVLVWMLVLASSAAGAHLIAQFVRRRERGVSSAPIFCGQGRISRAAPSRRAGALLAAAGVLLRLAGHPTGGLSRETALRGLTVVGVAVFLAIGLAMMLSGRSFLGYPVAWAGGLILFIETAATPAIAAILITAYLCGEP